jgi:hypothetical protein
VNEDSSNILKLQRSSKNKNFIDWNIKCQPPRSGHLLAHECLALSNSARSPGAARRSHKKQLDRSGGQMWTGQVGQSEADLSCNILERQERGTYCSKTIPYICNLSDSRNDEEWQLSTNLAANLAALGRRALVSLERRCAWPSSRTAPCLRRAESLAATPWHSLTQGNCHATWTASPNHVPCPKHVTMCHKATTMQHDATVINSVWPGGIWIRICLNGLDQRHSLCIHIFNLPSIRNSAKSFIKVPQKELSKQRRRGCFHRFST